MIKTDYLILGAGPAGSWAVRGIRQEDKEGRILIVGKEPRRAYFLPMLSKGYIQGRYPEEKLYLVKEDFYESNNARFMGGNGAAALDTDKKIVTLEDDEQVSYEKLLICTGGSPFRFRVPGADLRRIYYLRTLDDARIIRSASGSAHEAVVIGGSFIGVELAVALRELGLAVKLLMMENYIFQSLIPEEAGLYLTELMLENGVEIYPRQKVTEFRGRDGLAEWVVTEDGNMFKADMFCAGIGLTLNIGYLEGAGIETGRGIIVNEYLETNVEGVYAAGDVAEFEDIILGYRHLTGHIENALQQGRAAGRNMAGAKVEYAQVTGYDTEIFGTPLMFIGAPDGGEEFCVRRDNDDPRVCFSFRGGRLAGALLIKPGGKDIRVIKELVGMSGDGTHGFKEKLCAPDTDLGALLDKIKGKEGQWSKDDR
ncbi:MAG: FAD-dependent oxidoreductase [Deltaproteobacteria bacterium]